MYLCSMRMRTYARLTDAKKAHITIDNACECAHDVDAKDRGNKMETVAMHLFNLFSR